jgi:anti-anti-sigma regulatory factor
MPARITQIEVKESDATLVRVEGSLQQRDAQLLQRICRDADSYTVTLDLTGLNFLDSHSALVLCRLKHELGVRLEGLNLFIGKVLELAGEYEKAMNYLPKAEEMIHVSSEWF